MQVFTIADFTLVDARNTVGQHLMNVWRTFVTLNEPRQERNVHCLFKCWQLFAAREANGVVVRSPDLCVERGGSLPTQ